MENIIEKIIDRVTAYELLNSIIPGAIFIIITSEFTPFTLETGNLWKDLAIAYFVGLVIGRVGSLFVGWLFDKKRSNKQYQKYVAGENKDMQIRTLSTINNMYRTYAALAICQLLTVIFGYVWPLIESYSYSLPIVVVVGCILLFIIFSSAYVKQSTYVDERAKAVFELSKENKIFVPEDRSKK